MAAPNPTIDPTVDLALTVRDALLNAATATGTTDSGGHQLVGDVDALAAAALPLIWNAALAAARQAIFAEVYVGRFVHGDPGTIARSTRDEALDALRHQIKP